MKTLEAETHTPEALAAELEAVHDAGLLVVGSLGRAAYYSNFVGDPEYEFTARGEPVLGTPRHIRDIDVLGETPEELKRALFYVDDFAFGNALVCLRQERGDWVLASPYRDFYEEVHPDVMEPIELRGLFDVKIYTVPLQTHNALWSLNGLERKKDSTNKKLFDETMAELPKTLPVEFFEPFVRLGQMGRTDSLSRAQMLYRQSVPLPIRERLVPLARFIKRRHYGLERDKPIMHGRELV